MNLRGHSPSFALVAIDRAFSKGPFSTIFPLSLSLITNPPARPARLVNGVGGFGLHIHDRHMKVWLLHAWQAAISTVNEARNKKRRRRRRLTSLSLSFISPSLSPSPVCELSKNASPQSVDPIQRALSRLASVFGNGVRKKPAEAEDSIPPRLSFHSDEK